MERYNEYRETAIPWLAMLPSHWEEKRAKYIYEKQNRAPEETDEVITCFRDGEVTLRKNRRTSGFTESFKEIGYQGIKKGDLVIHQMDAFAGSTGVSDSDGKGTPVYSVCTPIDDQSLTLYHAKVIRLMGLNGFIQSLYRGIRERSSDFRFETFARQVLPLPPLPEQEKIVNYLESKTSKIDAYVADKEHEIQLLQEYKQKVIADAVTKGLNPNVKMKDSRTSFFGHIPAHWEERKMKYCFNERSEKNHPEEPVLCATQSQGVIPQSLYQNRVVVVNKGFEGLKFVKVGDFVISLRSFEGGIEYAYYQGIISAAYTILTPRKAECADYFKLLFKCYPFIQVLQTCVTGIREGQNINYQMLGRKYIPLPPLDEQRSIVSYIEEKCQKIDSLTTELQSEIDYLKEYKQRLIADCVTGQVNVQNH